jgi:ribonuclease HI
VPTGGSERSECYGKARDLLDALEEKWDTREPQPEDYEDEQAPREGSDEETIDFDARVTTHGTIADTFRIFTNTAPKNLHNVAPNTRHSPNPNEDLIEIYTDGSAQNNGSENARAGAGIYFGDDDPRNKAIRVPDRLKPSNNVGELVAIKETVEMCPKDIPLAIHSDSRVSIDILTRNLKKNEDEGFFLTANSALVRTTVTSLRKRRATTSLTWVKGHEGNLGNEAADKLADEGCEKDEPDEIKMRVDSSLVVPGAKLQAMTQSLAYKIIRKIKMNKPSYRELLNRKMTKRNMKYAQEAVADPSDEVPAVSKIWKSTKHKDLSRSVRFFLWMAIHGGYKIGRHWEKIPATRKRPPAISVG